MESIVGVWDLVMKTPIGSIPAVYTFVESGDALVGSAEGRGETAQLQDIACDGANVTWRQSITKPIRLNLQFEVHVTQDTLTGHSRAGRLPRSSVTGTRRTD
jgi:hypothetical protein